MGGAGTCWYIAPALAVELGLRPAHLPTRPPSLCPQRPLATTAPAAVPTTLLSAAPTRSQRAPARPISPAAIATPARPRVRWMGTAGRWRVVGAMWRTAGMLLTHHPIAHCLSPLQAPPQAPSACPPDPPTTCSAVCARAAPPPIEWTRRARRPAAVPSTAKAKVGLVVLCMAVVS